MQTIVYVENPPPPTADDFEKHRQEVLRQVGIPRHLMEGPPPSMARDLALEMRMALIRRRRETIKLPS